MATWTTPTNFAAEEIVTSTKLNEQVIQDLLYLYEGLSWTDFTPTWTNVTLGTGSAVYGRYRRIDDVVEFQAGFKLGAGGDVTGIIELVGPLTLVAVSGWTFGHGAITAFAADDSTNLRYSGAGIPQGAATTVWVRRIGDSDGHDGWDESRPFDWTEDDELHVSGTITVQ